MLLGKYWDKFGSIRPGKISIEDVRSLYGISRLEARTLCEMAVSEGLFEKKVGLTCPSPGCNGRIIAEFDLGVYYGDVDHPISGQIDPGVS